MEKFLEEEAKKNGGKIAKISQ